MPPKRVLQDITNKSRAKAPRRGATDRTTCASNPTETSLEQSSEESVFDFFHLGLHQSFGKCVTKPVPYRMPAVYFREYSNEVLDPNASNFSAFTATEDASLSSSEGRISPVSPLINEDCGLDEHQIFTMCEDQLSTESVYHQRSQFNQFMDPHCTYKEEHRRAALDFAITIAGDHGISRTVLWPAIAMFDAFIRKNFSTISKNNFISTILACLMFVHKLQRAGKFPLSNIIDRNIPVAPGHPRRQFQDAVFNCEFRLLTEEAVVVPSVWEFFQEYQSIMGLEFMENSMASCMIERAFLEHSFVLKYPPSMIAASAITLAKTMTIGVDTRGFTVRNVALEVIEQFRNRVQLPTYQGIHPTLSVYSKYTSADLHSCMNEILSFFRYDAGLHSMIFAKGLVNKKRQDLATANVSAAATSTMPRGSLLNAVASGRPAGISTAVSSTPVASVGTVVNEVLETPKVFCYKEFLQYLQQDVLAASLSHNVGSYDKEHLRFFTSIPGIFEELYLQTRGLPALLPHHWGDFVRFINFQINENPALNKIQRNAAMIRHPWSYAVLSNYLVNTPEVSDLINCYSSVQPQWNHDGTTA